ncbi:MAG: lipid IV(A) 3-deoxy-D-manno-octulosonic acid transferase [Methylomonas sp.]
MISKFGLAWVRKLYTLIFSAILPLVLLRLYWRGVKAPQYRQRWQERLGYYACESRGDVIWFHAVSVGEAEAAFPLIKLMQSLHPEIPFLVTTTTPTGSARVQSVLGSSVEHVYLPYDLPGIVDRFLAHFRPKIAVIMEKEIWPNLFAACADNQIPLYVINARLSARSAMAYLKIPSLVKTALAKISLIATQTGDDKQHFIDIGADPARVQVLGNIKFDVAIDESTVAAGQALKNALFQGRFVWIIASTHQGEEAVFLRLYAVLKAKIPQLLLLIVPRHPERFLAVRKLAEEQGLGVVMRSEHRSVGTDSDVYLADSMGELKMLYASADAAFVGGSLVPVGGHNVLEPAAVGLPVLFGPQMFNFQEIARQMLEVGAALQCKDETAIAEALLRLYENADFRDGLIRRAKVFVEQNQGATARVADLLIQSL